MKTPNESPRAVRLNRWMSIINRARRLAEQREKRNRGLALVYLRRCLPDHAGGLTLDNMGYTMHCLHNWQHSMTGDPLALAEKALALWNDYSGHRWADAVSRRAFTNLHL